MHTFSSHCHRSFRAEKSPFSCLDPPSHQTPSWTRNSTGDWQSKHVHLGDSTREYGIQTSEEGTGISLYRAVVLTTLLYEAESWVAYHCLLPFLEPFHQLYRCSILNIHWHDFVINNKVLKQAEVNSIKTATLKHTATLGRTRLQDGRSPMLQI